MHLQRVLSRDLRCVIELSFDIAERECPFGDCPLSDCFEVNFCPITIFRPFYNFDFDFNLFLLFQFEPPVFPGMGLSLNECGRFLVAGFFITGTACKWRYETSYS